MSSFQDYLSAFPTRKLKKGQTLLFQGEVPRQVYVIKSGAVKIYNISAQGEEKIITLGAPNDILTPSWAFNNSPVALYYYDAFADTELYALSKTEFAEILARNPAATRSLLERFVTLYVGSTVHINALEHSKSVDKIVHVLHYLMMRFGKERAKNMSRIELRLTHQDISNMIGLTRETVAMELAKLKKQGVISYQGQRYTIHTERLQRLHGEEDFDNVTLS